MKTLNRLQYRCINNTNDKFAIQDDTKQGSTLVASFFLHLATGGLFLSTNGYGKNLKFTRCIPTTAT